MRSDPLLPSPTGSAVFGVRRAPHPDVTVLALAVRVIGTALAVSLTAACAGGDLPPATRADSAGIEIVTTEVGAPSWALDPAPSVSLGRSDGGGPEEFYRVTDVELLSGGRIAVANQGSEEVRIFAGDGTFLGAFGGEGRGPEEFLRLSMVQDFADSLLTYDEGNDRVSVRTKDGRFVRSFRLEWFYGLLFPTDLGPDGEILAVTARHMTELRGSGIVVDTALVSLYDRRGALLDSLVRIPHNERFVKRSGIYQTTLGAPFGSWASLVASDGGFCATFGPAPEVRCRNAAGALVRILRVDESPRPVSREAVDAFWADMVAASGLPGSGPERTMQLRDDMIFPASFPAFEALIRDERGRFWARRFTAPGDERGEWLVFEDGRVVGRLATPPGLDVMDIEEDRLAGVWRDEMDIEHVRVYRWRRP